MDENGRVIPKMTHFKINNLNNACKFQIIWTTISGVDKI